MDEETRQRMEIRERSRERQRQRLLKKRIENDSNLNSQDEYKNSKIKKPEKRLKKQIAKQPIVPDLSDIDIGIIDRADDKSIAQPNVDNEFHYERFFLGIILIFGLLFCIITPPMQAPDEVTHFLKSYSLSQFEILPQIVDGQIVSEFDTNIYSFSQAFTQLQWDPNSKIDLNTLMNWVSTDVSGDTIQANYITVTSFLIYYIPQAIGMMLASVLQLSAYWILVFGRLTNLIVYAIVMYNAIKLTPVAKNIFFLVALMPMSVFLAASVSYDVMVIGIAALFIALMLRLIYDDTFPLSTGTFAGIIVLSSMLIFLKTVYYPLVILVLAIPSEKFEGGRERFKTLISIIVTNAIIFGLVAVFRAIEFSGATSEPSLAGAQIVYLVQNPAMIITVFQNTINSFGSAFQEGFIGNLGWLDTPLPAWLVTLYYLCFVGAAFAVEQDEAAFYQSLWIRNFRLGLYMAAIVTGFIVLLFITFYATVTVQTMQSIGTNVVLGLQGRYFIPISMLVFPAIKSILNAKFSIVQTYNQVNRKINIVYVIVALLVSIFVVISRYYLV